MHFGNGHGQRLQAEAEAVGGYAVGEAANERLLGRSLQDGMIEDEAGDQRVELADVIGPGEGVRPIAQRADVALVEVVEDCEKEVGAFDERHLVLEEERQVGEKAR